MPVYAYRCTKCGATFEVQQTSYDALSVCGQHCQADDHAGDGGVLRLVSLPARLTASRNMALGSTNYDAAARKGFTTYRKGGDGQYERVAGSGPAQLQRPAGHGDHACQGCPHHRHCED